MYSELVHVFSKVQVETLTPHRSIDHAIDLEPAFKLPYGRIYNLSEVEFRTLKAYIENNIAKDFMQWSSSWVPAPIVLSKKMDGGVSLCVDYCTLNLAIIKNWYPQP